MSNSVKTQSQAITLLTALQNVVAACNDTNSAQVASVKAFFKLVLGSNSPAISSSTALNVVTAIRKASLFYEGVSARAQDKANTIGSALLGVKVVSTQAQAEAVLRHFHDAYQSVNDEPGQSVSSANNLIKALLAL